MTAFVPTQLGVLLPSDINDLGAAGIADGEFAKRVAGAWDGVKAVEDAIHLPIPAGTLHYVESLNLGSGSTVIDLNVPSGYVFFPMSFNLMNTAATTNATAPYLRRGGTDYILRESAALNASLNTAIIAAWLFEYGDQLVISAASPGICVMISGVLLPVSGNLKAIAVSLSNGDNTVYTVPVGKKALVPPLTNSQVNTFTTFSMSNASGAARTLKAYHVPAAGSPAAGNMVFSSASGAFVNNGNRGMQFGVLIFSAGESLVINTNGTGQQLFLGFVYEVDV